MEGRKNNRTVRKITVDVFAPCVYVVVIGNRRNGETDMTSYIGRTFTQIGVGKAKTQKGTVIAQSAPMGKRGKVLLTCHLEDGTEFKSEPRHITWPIAYAPAATGPMFSRNDKYRYDRNGRIECA